MAYKLNGSYYVSCSCKVGCPCIFGEPEGHDGYCDAQMTANITSGEVGGVDVSGVTAVLAANWPKGFVSGGGKGRMYFDPSTSAEQRDAIARAFAGDEGGDLQGLGGTISEWLEPSEVSIELDTSDEKMRVTVGDVGVGAVEPMRNEAGEVTTVVALPVAFAPETVLGRGNGTRWTDPDMKQWESRGYGEQAEFAWSS
jgi:hypothetical protein